MPLFNYTLKRIKKHYKFVHIFREKMPEDLLKGQILLICQYIVEKPSVFYAPYIDLRFSKIFPGIKAGRKDSADHSRTGETLYHNRTAAYHKMKNNSCFSPEPFLRSNRDPGADIHRKNVQNELLPGIFRS